MSDTTPPAKNKVVMFVDDNTIDNFINQKIVINSKFSEYVYVHTNAQSALEFFKNIDELKTEEGYSLLPSHVFLDINMPISDGYYFLEEFDKLFSKKITSQVKIVMLTSSLNPNDEVKSTSYKSVVSYLLKPLTKDSLVNMV